MKRNLSPVNTLVRELIPVVGSFAPVAIGGTLAFDAGTGRFTVAQVLTGGSSGAVGTIASQTVSLGTLAYDGQSANFEEGEVVTGGTSGAVGIVEADIDGGATGTLTLSGIIGIFEDNEALTGDVIGVAVVNGTLLPTEGTITLTGIVGTFANNEAITDPVTGAAVANLTVVYEENAPTAKKGLGWSVVWTSPGLYTVTFTDGFNSLISTRASLQLATADDKLCQTGTLVNTATPVLQIRIWDKSANAVRDLDAADANNRIHFEAWFRASAAKPEYG